MQLDRLTSWSNFPSHTLEPCCPKDDGNFDKSSPVLLAVLTPYQQVPVRPHIRCLHRYHVVMAIDSQGYVRSVPARTREGLFRCAHMRNMYAHMHTHTQLTKRSTDSWQLRAAKALRGPLGQFFHFSIGETKAQKIKASPPKSRSVLATQPGRPSLCRNHTVYKQHAQGSARTVQSVTNPI